MSKSKDIAMNIAHLTSSIQGVIDEHCKSSGYEITYTEINAALSDLTRRNLGYELRDILKEHAAQSEEIL